MPVYTIAHETAWPLALLLKRTPRDQRVDIHEAVCSLGEHMKVHWRHLRGIKAVYVMTFIQLNLAISNSLISNNRLSRSENLVPA